MIGVKPDAPRRGRPVTLSPKEREAGRAASRAKSKAKSRNVTLDADVQAVIIRVQKVLEKRFGFKPTQSQTLRHVLKDYKA